jgi:2-amino-4-hydroxy-6-hydroxymethyldihydropteridine diphosphokinase
MKTPTYLLLGANLGQVQANLEQAILYIDQQVGNVVARSHFYTTSAWGNTQQPDFLNVAIRVDTLLTAQEVLETCQLIEKKMGRIRHQHWGARTMDIDIIFFGEQIINSSNLQIPHPLMAQRHFVLAPLAEIAPVFKHPILGKTISQLLENCPDASFVEQVLV